MVEPLSIVKSMDIQCLYSSDFHFMEKANGIKYLYAWLDRHPDVRAVVSKLPWAAISSGITRLMSIRSGVALIRIFRASADNHTCWDYAVTLQFLCQEMASILSMLVSRGGLQAPCGNLLRRLSNAYPGDGANVKIQMVGLSGSARWREDSGNLE